MMNDRGISKTEKEWINSFKARVQEKVAFEGFTDDLHIQKICEDIGLDSSYLHKDCCMMYALWVCLLEAVKNHLSNSALKYPTLEDFLNAYPGRFASESLEEQINLWHTANWMVILFKLIPAKKNKGLALQVVPKLIEGWDAKYVTGSGQTKATQNRVHIFETEGNTRANPRGRVKSKKRPAVKRGGSGKVRARSVLHKPATGGGDKTRKRKIAAMQYSARPTVTGTAMDSRSSSTSVSPPASDSAHAVAYNDGFLAPVGTVSQSREKRRRLSSAKAVEAAEAVAALHPTRYHRHAQALYSSPISSVDVALQHESPGSAARLAVAENPADQGQGQDHSSGNLSDGSTDQEMGDDAMQEDVKKAALMLWRDNSFGLGFDLSRSSSYLKDSGLCQDKDEQLLPLGEMQRGVSWTEIPTMDSASPFPVDPTTDPALMPSPVPSPGPQGVQFRQHLHPVVYRSTSQSQQYQPHHQYHALNQQQILPQLQPPALQLPAAAMVAPVPVPGFGLREIELPVYVPSSGPAPTPAPAEPPMQYAQPGSQLHRSAEISGKMPAILQSQNEKCTAAPQLQGVVEPSSAPAPPLSVAAVPPNLYTPSQVLAPSNTTSAAAATTTNYGECEPHSVLAMLDTNGSNSVGGNSIGGNAIPTDLKSGGAFTTPTLSINCSFKLDHGAGGSGGDGNAAAGGGGGGGDDGNAAAEDVPPETIDQMFAGYQPLHA